jgi:hypothetical protein
MQRWIGLLAIAARYLVLTVSVPGLTATVVSLSTTHGVELSEIVGGAATVVGVVAIWGG